MSKQQLFDDLVVWLRQQPDIRYEPASPSICAIGQFGQAVYSYKTEEKSISRQVMDNYSILPEDSCLSVPNGWWLVICAEVADDNTYHKLADRLEADRERYRD